MITVCSWFPLTGDTNHYDPPLLPAATNTSVNAQVFFISWFLRSRVRTMWICDHLIRTWLSKDYYVYSNLQTQNHCRYRPPYFGCFILRFNSIFIIQTFRLCPQSLCLILQPICYRSSAASERAFIQKTIPWNPSPAMSWNIFRKLKNESRRSTKNSRKPQISWQ